MKKVCQLLKLLSVAFILILSVTSCGNKKKEISIKPVSTSIKGDLSEYFEVVDGSYQLSWDGDEYSDYIMKVQLKRKDKEFDFDAKDLESRGYFNLCSSLFGDGGTPIIIGSTDGMGIGICHKGRVELTTAKSGEINWVEFSFSPKEEIAKSKTFEINSTVDKEKSHSSSSSSNTKGKSTSITSNDCDQFIKEYTAFVNSYVKLLKKYKANPTDPTILNEYTESVTKATELQQHASTCTDAKYASKLLELSNKITQAVY